MSEASQVGLPPRHVTLLYPTPLLFGVAFRGSGPLLGLRLCVGNSRRVWKTWRWARPSVQRWEDGGVNSHQMSGGLQGMGLAGRVPMVTSPSMPSVSRPLEEETVALSAAWSLGCKAAELRMPDRHLRPACHAASGPERGHHLQLPDPPGGLSNPDISHSLTEESLLSGPLFSMGRNGPAGPGSQSSE